MTRTETMLDLLIMDSGWRDPNPERSGVTAIQHALQCATRAFHHVPQDHELICAALLHDAARPYSDIYHGQVMAMMLKDKVRNPVFEALYDHGVYQEALLHPKRHLNPAQHHESLALASWDAVSFDPTYKTYELAWFIPFMQKLFGEPLSTTTPHYEYIADYVGMGEN